MKTATLHHAEGLFIDVGLGPEDTRTNTPADVLYIAVRDDEGHVLDDEDILFHAGLPEDGDVGVAMKELARAASWIGAEHGFYD